MSVEEHLDFDVSEALAGIAQIEAALTAAAAAGGDALTAAIADAASAPVDIADVDATAVTDGIDAAVASADTSVEMQADGTAVTDSIDTAVSAADTEVIVTADASELTAAIEEAVQAADTTVVPTGGESGGGGLTSGILGLEAAAGAAAGNMGGLTKAVGSFGPEAEAAAAGAAAAAEGIHVLIDAALEADTVERRATLVLGQFREAVENVDVGTLHTNLDDLARSLGEVPTRLLGASIGVFSFAKNSGLGGEAAAQFTNQVDGLAARIVARNPDIGSLADVTTRLNRALAGSPRALIPLGLSLDPVAVKARALSLGLVDAEGNVTRIGKAVAGAQLLMEKFGDTLGDDVAKGSEFAVTQLRQIKVAVTEAFEAFGKPLLKPFLDLMKAAEPLLEQFGKLFGEIGEAVLPLATELLPPLVDVLKILTDVLGPLLAELEPLAKILHELNKFSPLPFIHGLTSGLSGLTGGGEAAAGVLVAVGVAAFDAIAPATAFADAIGVQKVGITDLASAIRILGVGAIDDLLSSIRAAPDPMAALTAAAGRMGIGVDTLKTIMEGAAKQLDGFTNVLTSKLSGVDRALGNFKPNQGLKSFVDNLGSETKRTADFVAAIDTLVQRGALSLAALLAAEGPEALRPAQQAAALRGDLLATRETQASQSIDIDKKAVAQQEALAPKLLKGLTDPLAKDGGTEIGNAIARATAAAQGATVAAFSSLGRSGIEGFVLGINSGSEDAAAAAALAAAAAIRAARGTLRITSPSREFYEIGRLSMQGQANGTDESDEPVKAVKKQAEKMKAAAKNAATDTAKELSDLAKRLADVQDTGTATSKALDLLGPVRLARLLAEFRAGTITLAEFNRLLKQTGLTADDLLDVISETRSEMQQFTDDAVSGLASLEDALNGVKENESLDDFLLRIRQNTVKTAQFLLDIQQLIKRGADDLAAAFLAAGIDAAFAAHQAAGLSASALAARERQLEVLQSADAANQANATKEAQAANKDGSPQNVGGSVVQHITVNEVANDPHATASAVSARQAQEAHR